MATLDQLRTALIELDEVTTLRVTRELLAQDGPTPLSILATCQQGLKVVGERYERQEYYISGLIMAGELFKEVLQLVRPVGTESVVEETAGTVVLGTVAKDIHDIGKNLFGSALMGFGFKVIDLGVDVPPGALPRRGRARAARRGGPIRPHHGRLRQHEADGDSSPLARVRARLPAAGDTGRGDHRRPGVRVRGRRLLEHGRHGRGPYLPAPHRAAARPRRPRRRSR